MAKKITCNNFLRYHLGYTSDEEEEYVEEDPNETEEYFQSKDEKLIWSLVPPSDR